MNLTYIGLKFTSKLFAFFFLYTHYSSITNAYYCTTRGVLSNDI